MTKNLKSLGETIRGERMARGESISQVARDLGIDPSYLSRVERGIEVPSKSFVNRILARFYSSSADYDEKLKKFLGSDNTTSRSNEFISNINQTYGKEVIQMEEQQIVPLPTKQVQEMQVHVPAKLPILYTDSVIVFSSPFGVVLEFAQKQGPTNAQEVVARVGMSFEHAQAFLQALGSNLMQKK